MEVLSLRWREYRRLLAEGGTGPGNGADRGLAAYFMTLPVLILIVSVVMYCALLSKRPPSLQLIWSEVFLVGLSLLSSLIHWIQLGRALAPEREGR